MNKGYEEIRNDGELLAVIIYEHFESPGITFFTSDDLSQQIAYMHHPTNKVIDAHVHSPAPRQVVYTQETLFIKQGQLRVDFYSSEQRYLESRILGRGDTILLVSGGHGFKVLEEVKMIEVKQGPYSGDTDKIRFAPVLDTDINTNT